MDRDSILHDKTSHKTKILSKKLVLIPHESNDEASDILVCMDLISVNKVENMRV